MNIKQQVLTTCAVATCGVVGTGIGLVTSAIVNWDSVERSFSHGVISHRRADQGLRNIVYNILVYAGSEESRQQCQQMLRRWTHWGVQQLETGAIDRIWGDLTAGAARQIGVETRFVGNAFNPVRDAYIQASAIGRRRRSNNLYQRVTKHLGVLTTPLNWARGKNFADGVGAAHIQERSNHIRDLVLASNGHLRSMNPMDEPLYWITNIFYRAVTCMAWHAGNLVAEESRDPCHQILPYIEGAIAWESGDENVDLYFIAEKLGMQSLSARPFDSEWAKLGQGLINAAETVQGYWSRGSRWLGIQ